VKDVSTPLRENGEMVHLLSRSNVPPRHAEERDKRSNANGVIHVCGRDRFDGREEQNDTDEADPDDCHSVDGLTPFPEGVWAFDELHSVLIDTVSNDDSDVADIQCRCCDIENGNDGQGAADADQVETTAEEDNEPDSVDGRVCELVDLAPEAVLVN
jgi:hypothetical protein